MTEYNEIYNITQNIFETIESELNNKWKTTSKYFKIRSLPIDKRGSFGERFFNAILSEIARHTKYNDGNKGNWDLEIDKLKLEIKTSSLDVNNKFQNENIKDTDDYDGILFLGIASDDIYIKFIRNNDIQFNKLHCREKNKTGAGYK